MADSEPIVAAVQAPIDDLAVDRNVDRLRERIVNLPDRVDVAICPEYALTGFVDDERLSAVALDRSTALDRLADLAAVGGVDVVAGYVEWGEGRNDGSGLSRVDGADGAPDDPDGDLYNATAYVPGPDSEGRDPTVYRKRHLWGGERERLRSGTDRVVVETPAGPTGILTCYDLNFVAESAWFTDCAVDALFVPGAWPAAHTANWRLLLRARALDGVRWVVGAGRTGGSGSRAGEGDPTEYAGNSLVARPDGRIAAALGHEARDLIVPLDRGVLDRQRDLVGSVPDTKDR